MPSPQETWIVDSTPLIVLAKINYLFLLPLLSASLVIPQTVADEVQAGDKNDPARASLLGGWGQIIPTPPIPIPVAALHLDAGEEAVLSVALARPGSRAVIDDGKARAAAQALSVPMIGTLGVIARARVADNIPAAKPLVVALRQVGFHADDDLLTAILNRLGEVWP